MVVFCFFAHTISASQARQIRKLLALSAIISIVSRGCGRTPAVLELEHRLQSSTASGQSVVRHSRSEHQHFATFTTAQILSAFHRASQTAVEIMRASRYYLVGLKLRNRCCGRHDQSIAFSMLPSSLSPATISLANTKLLSTSGKLPAACRSLQKCRAGL